jgi:hypothetical protein
MHDALALAIRRCNGEGPETAPFDTQRLAI